MLHRFAIADGAVSYRNRVLVTPGSTAVREHDRIGYAEFATDPCASLFGRFFTRFSREPSGNANVNITRVGDRMVALTEPPMPVEFDPETLDTIGVAEYPDAVGGATSTAHPLTDPRTGDLINVVLAFGRRSEYRVTRYDRDHGMTVTAQPSGHGATGDVDGAILLRTGRLDELSVDPDARTARVGASVTWGQVQAVAGPHGLTGLPGSSPAVSVAGHTLGGGLSWFGRKHGWAADSVTAFDVIDAEGHRAPGDRGVRCRAVLGTTRRLLTPAALRRTKYRRFTGSRLGRLLVSGCGRRPGRLRYPLAPGGGRRPS